MLLKWIFLSGLCDNLYKTLQIMMKKLPRQPQLEMFKFTLVTSIQP